MVARSILPLVAVLSATAGAFPDRKRDIRNCQACASAWPVLEKGTKLGSNMEKSAFFATRTGSQSDPKRSKKLFDEVRKACMANPVEGESSRRHSRQCMTTAKQLTRSSILSQWCVLLVFCCCCLNVWLFVSDKRPFPCPVLFLPDTRHFASLFVCASGDQLG